MAGEKQRNTYGVEVDVTPWSAENGYRVVNLHMIEKLGGFIPTGQVELFFDGEITTFITEDCKGEILLKDTKKGGIEYKIPFFVTSRAYYKNTLVLDFVCISDKTFFTELVVRDYDDISDALNSLYPGKKDIRTKSDIKNNIPVHQWGDNNYKFCTRLAYAYKKESVFAYSWEGFMLKDLYGEKNSKGKDERSLNEKNNTMTDLYMLRTQPYSLNYNKYLNYIPYDTWQEKQDYNDHVPDWPGNDKYKDLAWVNGQGWRNYDYYHAVAKTKSKKGDLDYSTLLDNYLYNKRIMDSNMYTSFMVKSQVMPNYKIGDVFYYKSTEQESASYPFKLYIVFSNEVFFSDEGTGKVDSNGLRFSWTSLLLGLDKGTWTKENS